ASLLALAGDRVTLLETLRVYASERLAAVGDLAEGQQRHAVYYAAFAHQVFDGLLGEEQATWMQRGLADHNNCLAALRWALAGEQGDLAVSLASSLWWFWYRQGLFALGTEMLQAALRLSSTNLSQRARALNGLASFHLVHDDYAASLACHEEGLTLRRALGDALGVATALHNMALTAHTMGDSRQALAWLQESIDADLSADPAQAWAHMGVIALDMLDLAQARQWLERAHAQVMQEPAGWMQAFVQLNLADVLWECRDIAAARRMAQRSLDLFTALSDAYYLPDPQLLLAQIAHAEGDDKLAGNLCALARDQYEARQDVVLTASALLLEAELARSRGDLPQAATLREQAAALRRSVKRPLNPREQARYAGV
ncbi:MAG: tetratricopeptide repeat protein, partial [Anaerolineae bacterium]